MSDANTASEEGEKKIRLYMDGCFDITHYGHANAARQAKQHGDYLVAGVHPDDEVKANKGPPVYSEEERYRIVSAFRWVDEVAKDAPYSTTIEYLKKYRIDYHVHGDDISISNETGLDCNSKVKDAGLFQEVSRTPGVSTTDLVGRILLVTKTHHIQSEEDNGTSSRKFEFSSVGLFNEIRRVNKHFLARSKMIADFAPRKVPKPGDRVVYTAGAFDLMHAGHVDFLEAAAKEGDFLIVGINSDVTVNMCKGANYPIMNLHERTLSTLAFKYVDEVIIGAPYTLTESMLNDLKIDVVVHGISGITDDYDGEDPYKVAKSKGIFKIIDSGSKLTTNDIIMRILSHRDAYAERNRISEEKFMRQEKIKAELLNSS